MGKQSTSYIKVKYSNSKTIISMKKPNMMAILAIVTLAGSSLVLAQTLQFASAQYGGQGGILGGESSAGSIEEQLELAREKISNAEQAGAYGSGTAMLGTNITDTMLFIGILVVIFGAVAGMFFYRSRVARKASA